jgi:hypothetical protein
MKPLFCAVFVGLLTIPSLAQKLEGPEFETLDSSFSTGIQGWRSNKLYEFAPDEIIRHAGRRSMRVKSIAGKQFGAFSQMVSIPSATSLRKFRISGWLKRDSVERFAGIWVNVFEGENSLFFDNMQQKQLNGTADWQEISTTFFVDASATEMQIGGLVVGSGQAWFDDFSLTEIPINAEDLPDSLKMYLNEKNALHRDLVDWPKEREVIMLMASGAKNYADCYPMIRHLLIKLGDHHSFLMEASKSQEWSNPDPEAYKKMPLTTGEILDGNIAYLSMPQNQHLFCQHAA